MVIEITAIAATYIFWKYTTKDERAQKVLSKEQKKAKIRIEEIIKAGEEAKRDAKFYNDNKEKIENEAYIKQKKSNEKIIAHKKKVAARKTFVMNIKGSWYVFYLYFMQRMKNTKRIVITKISFII